ncbi:uncharacterized protein [Equus caballus]|uniref:uncharacterized protein n=1 Tax=Equus caballus TaxID=9796 RepID=UPI0038B264F1
MTVEASLSSVLKGRKNQASPFGPCAAGLARRLPGEKARARAGRGPTASHAGPLPPQRARSRPGGHLSPPHLWRLRGPSKGPTPHSHYQLGTAGSRASAAGPVGCRNPPKLTVFLQRARHGEVTSRAPAFREVRPQGADHSAPRLRPSAPAGETPFCSAAPPPPWGAGRRRGKRGRRLVGFAGRDASGGGCFAGASFKACGGGSIEGDEDPREHSKQAVAQVVGVGRQSCENQDQGKQNPTRQPPRIPLSARIWSERSVPSNKSRQTLQDERKSKPRIFKPGPSLPVNSLSTEFNREPTCKAKTWFSPSIISKASKGEAAPVNPGEEFSSEHLEDGPTGLVMERELLDCFCNISHLLSTPPSTTTLAVDENQKQKGDLGNFEEKLGGILKLAGVASLLPSSFRRVFKWKKKSICPFENFF